MYARIQLTSARPDGVSQPPVADVIARHPGHAGHVFAAQPDGPAGALVTFWDTEADALAASARTEAATGRPRPVQLTYDEVFTVAWSTSGDAAGEQPTCLQLVCFDGPRDAAQQEADARASERVRHALRDVPGQVCHYALTRPDGGWVAMTLATSFDTLEQAQRRAMSTALGADEDPALLGGPDRVIAYSLVASQLPAPVPTGSTRPATPQEA